MTQDTFFIPETPPYGISAELYEEAYRVYQRRFLLWKNWILEAVLVLLSIDFIVAACKDPSNPLVYFLILLCLLCLGMLVFHPMRIRRRVMDVVKDMGEFPYQAALSEESIVIRTLPAEGVDEIPPTVLAYDQISQIMEEEQFFLICEGKECFYVLPKKALYDEQIFAMRTHFEQTLGKRFSSKLI